ncbi:MAG: ATP-binding cassette domain-containing protein [Thermoleophilaceae bacterium]
MPLLEIDAVTRGYWRGANRLEVLRDVSLEVHPGELVAVYGQRSSGKTTLLKLAAGFEPPDGGRVLFDGGDLAQLTRGGLARLHRSHIGWVERGGPHSDELSVRAYVALPLYRTLGPVEAERRAVAALARVGASDCADGSWEDLSDTARALVAIAQALVREPRLLVVDDPTAGLGILDRERVVGLLRAAAEDGGLGVLMAVPDMPSMLHAHQVRSLSRGSLRSPAPRAAGGHDNVVELAPRSDRPSEASNR